MRPLDRPSVAISARASGDALRVPAVIGILFWVIKGLSTAMGESTSDFAVKTLHPVPAVLFGFVAFAAALGLQLSMRRYRAEIYWLAVVMVGVFGTMAADVLHVGLGVPYAASTVLCAISLAVVFTAWQHYESTLSIHSIDTTRRELFYWATVVGTFALGTAAGDLIAITFHLGYFWSAVVFAAFISIPAIGYWRFQMNPVLAFWFAYVMTRPLGASVADWLGKPASDGGLGWGSGWVALGLTLMIVVLVAYLAVTRRDAGRIRTRWSRPFARQ